MTLAYGKQLVLSEPFIPDSLAGTRTSNNWKKPPGGMDRLNTRAVFPSSNEWDIPDLPEADFIPTGLVAYSLPKDIDKAPEGSAVHFFLDDYRFETIWTNPHRGLERIAKLGAALTPDFSMWRDMPLVMQQWQVYRARWCGAWLHINGIDVIPTVTWSTPETFKFAFAGIAQGSVVAISTVGVRDQDAKTLFAMGCRELVKRINPKCVLIYGQPGIADLPNTEVRYYPTRWMTHGR